VPLERGFLRSRTQDAVEVFEHDEPLLGQSGGRWHRTAFSRGTADRGRSRDCRSRRGRPQSRRGPFSSSRSTVVEASKTASPLPMIVAAGKRALTAATGVPNRPCAKPFGDGAAVNHEGVDPLLNRPGHDLPEVVLGFGRNG